MNLLLSRVRAVAYVCWCLILPFGLCMTGSTLWHSPLGWAGILAFSCGLLSFAYWLAADWRDARRTGWEMSDKIPGAMAVMQSFGSFSGCFSKYVSPRALPPVIWVIVVYDHSGRIYQGWCLRKRGVPGHPGAIRLNWRCRQVA